MGEWKFVFIPKYNKIIGVKTDINYAGVELGDDGKTPQKYPKGHEHEGEDSIIINSRPLIQEFTKAEYDEFVNDDKLSGGE